MTPWLLASGDFTTAGGMDRANHALARYLAARGDVHLVAHRVAPDLSTQPRVRVHHVPRPLGAHLLGAPLLAREAARTARALGPAARALMNGGNGPTSTPTWVHYLHAAYTPEVAASVRTRISATAGRRYYLARERAAIARAPLVICNSCSTADTVARCYGVAPARLRVVYYGSDPVAFSWAGDQERVEARRCVGAREGRLCAVFIGALGDRRKGFDLVFEAWRTLSADATWDVDLVVAGHGAEQDAWAARTATAGLTGRIRFLGFTANIPQLLAASDVLVHPARYEAYGLGVHEGLCRGVPSIVTRSAGVTERMPESLSPLVIADPPDAGQLAAALTTWRSDPDRWRQAARAAGDVLRARTWDAMAAEIAAAVEAA